MITQFFSVNCTYVRTYMCVFNPVLSFVQATVNNSDTHGYSVVCVCTFADVSERASRRMWACRPSCGQE